MPIQAPLISFWLCTGKFEIDKLPHWLKPVALRRPQAQAWNGVLPPGWIHFGRSSSRSTFMRLKRPMLWIVCDE